MAVFRINLIRDSTPPPEMRQAIFRAMTAYVALWGVFLVATAYTGTRSLMALHGKRLDVAGTEQAFLRSHPGADVVAHARDVRQQLDDAVGQLEAVNALREQRLELSRVFLALVAPLPTDVNITALDVDWAKGMLGFDLIFPVDAAGQGLDISRLISTWNADPLLAAQVRKISSGKSQRQRVEGKFMETWHFTCTPVVGGS